MNGYLVVIRCRSEDIPVALVADGADAIKIAYKFDPATPDGSQYMDDVVRRIDWSHPLDVFDISVVKFAEGYPIKTTYCRSLGN